MLIGIAGRAGSGKNTFADMLFKYVETSEWAFADLLKEVVMIKFGLTREDVYTQEGKNKFLPHLGCTVRELLIDEGHSTREKYGENFWINRLMQRIERHYWDDVGRDSVDLITDVRYDNEAMSVVSRGGLVIRVNKELGEYVGMNHVSEKGVNSDLIIEEFDNNGSLEDLMDSAKLFAEQHIPKKYWK